MTREPSMAQRMAGLVWQTDKAACHQSTRTISRGLSCGGCG